MIFYLPLLALLALLSSVSAEEKNIPALPDQDEKTVPLPKLAWKGEFPTGYVVIPEDEIRFPLDDYVSMTGATFAGKGSEKLPVVQKIEKQSTFNYESGVFEGCKASSYQGESGLLMICKGFHLVRIFADPISGKYKEEQTMKLSSDKIDEADTKCFDIIVEGVKVYVLCTSSKASEHKIVGFKIDLNTFKSPQVLSFSIPDKAFTSNAPIAVKKTGRDNIDGELFLFHTIGDKIYTSGKVSFVTCILLKNSNAATCSTVDLYSSIGLFKGGVIKYIGKLGPSTLVAATALVQADKNPQNNTSPTQARVLGFTLINIASSLSLSPIKNSTYIEGDKIPNFDPFKMALMRVQTDDKPFVMADAANIYFVKFSTNSTNLILKAPVINSIDCGDTKEKDIFAYKVIRDSLTSRVLVTYASANNRIIDLKSFSIYFSPKKYACSQATGMGAPEVVNFYKSDTGYCFGQKNITFLKLSPDTTLSLKQAPKLDAGEKKLTITAKIGKETAIEKVFSYTYYPDVKDCNKITIPNKKITAYGDSFFMLPVSQASFIASAPEITAKVEGNSDKQTINIRNIKKNTVKLDKLDTADNNIVDRIYAVDSNTFLAAHKKDSKETFSMIWSNVDVEGNITYTASPKVKALKDDYSRIFQTFKLGPDHYCIIMKRISNSIGSFFSCYQDKVNGSLVQIKVKGTKKNDAPLTANELVEVRVLEFSNRVEIISLVSQQSNKVIEHVLVKISYKGEVEVSDPKILEHRIDPNVYKNLQDYKAEDVMFDFWGDKDSSTYLVLKMHKPKKTPIIAKFQVSFGSTPKLEFLNYIFIPTLDVSYCSIKDELILYNHKANKIYSKTWAKTSTGAMGTINEFQFPLKTYGFVYVNRFLCLPEKASFQILASTKDKNKYVATFRGGDSHIAPRRVHSMIQVDGQSNFVESGSCFEKIVTVVGRPGSKDVSRDFIVTYPEGPLISVDNKGIKDNYTITVKSDTKNGKDVTEKLEIEIITPLLSPKIARGKAFKVEENQVVALDDMTNIEGPVMDVSVTGAEGIDLVKRMNTKKKLKTTATETPDRMWVVRDFMVTYYKKANRVIFNGNPTLDKNTGQSYVTEIKSLNDNDEIKDLQVLPKGTGQEVLVVIKTFSSKDQVFQYNFYLLTKQTAEKVTYKHIETLKVYTTNTDYDSLQMVPIGDKFTVLALRNKKQLVSNFIKLVAVEFTIDQKFKLLKEGRVFTSSHDDIGYYSVIDGSQSTAVIVSQFVGQPGFIAARWYLEGNSTVATFARYQTPFKLNGEEKTLVFKYMKCFNKNDNMLEVECIIDSEGINDHLITFTVGDPGVKNSMIINKASVKQEFIMPPLFEIKRISRGKDFYGFLLKRSKINNAKDKKKLKPEADDYIDNFKDCDYIIAVYKAGQKFIHTGTTCSQFGPGEVDFAMNEDGKEYIYHTLTPFPKEEKKEENKRVLQTATPTIASKFVSSILMTFKQKVDTSKVKLTFIGLKGTNAPEDNNSMMLSEFEEGKDPEKKEEEDEGGMGFWGWFLIFLLIVALVVGGFFAWKWWQGRNSTASSSSYQKAVDTNTSSDALQDERL